MVSGMGTERTTMKLLRLILACFPKWAQKESKLNFGDLFWLGFCVGTEIMKTKILRPILAWFPNWAQKMSKSSS